MRARALTHWAASEDPRWASAIQAREALRRGCSYGLEHRGELVRVLDDAPAPEDVAPELDNWLGEPVAVTNCDYCGDDAHDGEGDYCRHCVSGLLAAAHASAGEWCNRTQTLTTVAGLLPPSVADYLRAKGAL